MNILNCKSKIWLIFLWWSSAVRAFCQQELQGTIINGNNGEPIPFAFIYVNGSTKSATTDSLGLFSFTISQLPAQIELSQLNYHPMSYKIEVIPSEPITIKMKEKENMLEEVLILGKQAKAAYLTQFRAEFLGIDYWGQHAHLVNEESLIFHEVDDGFQVTTNEPLLVDLLKLGYQVRVELIEFHIKKDPKFKALSTRILAKYHFSNSESIQKRTLKNREKVYYNSPQHFITSLFHNELSENGYEIYAGARDPRTYRMIYQRVNLGDSVIYVNSIIKKLDQKGREYQVLYRPSSNGKPLDLTQQKPNSLNIQSSVYFNTDNVLITGQGTSPTAGISFTGVLGTKRVGATLPSDYSPED